MSIITIIIFICMPIMAVPLIIFGLIKDRKHNIVYIILLALYFAILAYNFIPDESKDLCRYFGMMTHYKSMNIEEYMTIAFNNNKSIFIALMFFISHIGNYHILPFICVFIGYSIIFYMISDYAKIKQISVYKELFIMATFIGVFYFISFFSGLAQVLAITICALAIYLETVKNKKGLIYKILYILAFFIHSSTIVIIIFRILQKFNFKKLRIPIYIVFLLYALLPTLVNNYLQIFANIPLIGNLIEKSTMYLIDTRGIFSTVYNIALACFIIFYFIIFILTRKDVKEKIGEKYCEFLEIMLVFNIASVQYSTIFIRFSFLIIILMNIYLLQILDNNKKNIKKIIIVMMILFSIVFTSVNINILKTEDFNNIFSNMFDNLFYYFKV